MAQEQDGAAVFAGLIDLASEQIGGQVLFANDDFFAEKENLIKPGRGVFIPGKYTDRGKWMDGWESRRKRVSGHDYCILRLGTPGVIRGLDIDTNHFLGNHPPYASVEACFLPKDASLEQLAGAHWEELLPQSPLGPGRQNLFGVHNERQFSHVKLHIYPDGGVARLRVYGEVEPDWTKLQGQEIDLVAAGFGGQVVACSDMFFGPPNNLLMPNRGVNMGDGWETRRKRQPGHDWVVIRLGKSGVVSGVTIDTAHFKGNYPDRAMLEGVYAPEFPLTELVRDDVGWLPLLAEQKLQADHVHQFSEEIRAIGPITHVRLSIFPDGGVSRLRVVGKVQTIAWEKLNGMSEAEAHQALLACCGSQSWVQAMVQARPFTSEKQLRRLAHRTWFAMREQDWLEAFSHHPEIGEAKLRERFAATAEWAKGEQAGVQGASEQVLQALADGNKRYREKNGFVFLVCATGKGAHEMLALLEQRLAHERATELAIAAREQAKITQLRLEKL
jgi:allantoicase